MMISSFEVEVTEKKDKFQTLEAYGENLNNVGKEKFLNEFGDIMIMAIHRYAPKSGVGAQGGKLATTPYYEVKGDIMTMFLQSYWPHVEFDTKPHVILPRRPGGVIAFPNPDAAKGGGVTFTKDQMIFTKKVNHPGTKGQFFIAKSWNRSRALVESLLDQYAKGTLQ